MDKKQMWNINNNTLITKKPSSINYIIYSYQFLKIWLPPGWNLYSLSSLLSQQIFVSRTGPPWTLTNKVAQYLLAELVPRFESATMNDNQKLGKDQMLIPAHILNLHIYSG